MPEENTNNYERFIDMDSSRMILSVTQINEYIRSLINQDEVLSMITVRGEISNLTIHRSGHIYFTLKDEGSVLKAVLFRSSAQKIKFALKEGMGVIVYGRVSVYAPSGQYQLYAENIQPDGIGALYLAYEQIKQRLANEGLFDSNRKKSLPQFPSNIGIVTSPTGAAIHDMINVMSRRYPIAKLTLYPSLVQGENAYKSIISGIRYFNETKSVDIIIIGRGGGSLEDLWAFNSVELAYAIADSEIPIISAVGHESDFTIADFVADLRAPTPSAAAELAVPDALSVRNSIKFNLSSIEKSTLAKITQAKQRLAMLASSGVLTSKLNILDSYRMNLTILSDKLDSSIESIISNKKFSFSISAAKLNSISPLNTLSRGYAIVQNNCGTALSSIKDFNNGDEITVHLADGNLKATVTKIHDNGEKHDA
ncbi:MAG: exodeoxyribonuclease VII large subunit [Bacteroidales bacterium]|nr:exodeoxyribonuclease VII large subunit [Bacteroidales bacterium]MBQ7873493.1 exodeoxyribonuclease VII large subunit [Clostridia bacterium]